MRARVYRRIGLTAVLLGAALATGCDDAATTTSPTATSPVTELFSAQ